MITHALAQDLPSGTWETRWA